MGIDILGLKQQQYSNAIFFNILLHNKYLTTTEITKRFKDIVLRLLLLVILSTHQFSKISRLMRVVILIFH